MVLHLGQRERRFAGRRILVRWHDGWVDPTMLRESLVEVLDTISSEVRTLVDGCFDELEAADRIARRMSPSARNSRFDRLMRQRLPGKQRKQAMFVLAAVGLGAGPRLTWENHDPNSTEIPLAHVFDRMLGLDRARSDRFGGSDSMLSCDTPIEDLVREATDIGAMDMLQLAQPIQEASADVIDQAFIDARVFASLSRFAEALQAVYGEDAGGVRTFNAMLEDEPDAVDLALLIRQMILLRPHAPEGRIEELREELDELKPQIDAILLGAASEAGQAPLADTSAPAS